MKLNNNQCILEIQDTQDELESWFRGDKEVDFGRIEQRQTVDMTIVSTSGLFETRTEFNKRYRGLFGKYPDLHLSVDIVRTKRISDEMILVVYQQKTKFAKTEILRITTAVFRYDEKLKNSAAWYHIHSGVVAENK